MNRRKTKARRRKEEEDEEKDKEEELEEELVPDIGRALWIPTSSLFPSTFYNIPISRRPPHRCRRRLR